MKYYSTRDKNIRADPATAIVGSLAPDGGLYFPEAILPLPEHVRTHPMSIAEIAVSVLLPYFSGALPDSAICDSLASALSFEAPVHALNSTLSVLELFHGPTLAFKDFGARVMAELMSKIATRQGKIITVLTATSGDTGAAVANAFYRKPGVEVVVLYPKGRVSLLQQLQMTTLGGNIRAFEVDGSFDDCQALVKIAFADKKLSDQFGLVSANSINISRLLPQTLYYLSALQHFKFPEKIAFCVPSGNFGNIFAAMLVRAMGIPELQVVAATNSNNTFVKFLQTAHYQPQRSLHTISNAMDVGAPSNVERIRELVGDDVSALREFCWASSVGDDQTIAQVKRTYSEQGYTVCPHTAVGLHAANQFRESTGWAGQIVSLATAHPAKFADVLQTACSVPVHIPDSLQMLTLKESKHVEIANTYEVLAEAIASP